MEKRTLYAEEEVLKRETFIPIPLDQTENAPPARLRETLPEQRV